MLEAFSGNANVPMNAVSVFVALSHCLSMAVGRCVRLLPFEMYLGRLGGLVSIKQLAAWILYLNGAGR